MLRVDVTIPRFIDAVVRSSIASDFAGIVFVLARTSDGARLQDELYENWSSLHDLTHDQLLLVVAGKGTHGVAALTEPVAYEADDLSIPSWLNKKWRADFLREMPGVRYWGALPQPPEGDQSFKTSITTSTSSAARHFGIPERYLPCIIILAIHDNAGVVVSLTTSDPYFTIYKYLRKLLIDFEPLVSGICAQQQLIYALKHDIRQVRRNLEREQKAINNYAQQWKVQLDSVMAWLDKLKNLERYREYVDVLRAWLGSSGNSACDYEKTISELLVIINNEEGESLRYQRLKKKLPRAATRRLSLVPQTLSQPFELQIAELNDKINIEIQRMKEMRTVILEAAKHAAIASGFCEEVKTPEIPWPHSERKWKLRFMVPYERCGVGQVSPLRGAYQEEAMASSPSTRTKVFISYSHADREWLERLKRHLKPLVREGHLDCWDDTHIRPGDDWKQEICAALDTARVAVLLISADFFASDFIDETELPPLLDAAQAKGVRILPVILSASQFTWNPNLARFQTVNPPDRPLAKMPTAEQEEVFNYLAQTIRATFNPR